MMVGHYTTEEDEQFRHASNRTHHRILISLPVEFAIRYGHRPHDKSAELERRLAAAVAARDWEIVERLAAKLKRRRDLSADGDGR